MNMQKARKKKQPTKPNAGRLRPVTFCGVAWERGKTRWVALEHSCQSGCCKRHANAEQRTVKAAVRTHPQQSV